MKIYKYFKNFLVKKLKKDIIIEKQDKFDFNDLLLNALLLDIEIK